MLHIVVPESEYFDERTQEFVKTKSQKLVLEHSLVSLAKWEAKWKKPFLSKEEKTVEETIDYIRDMTITQNVNPMVYLSLTNQNIDEINDYILDSMTATTFSDNRRVPPSREGVTAELIYYWMTVYNIPFECQKWHLNRLMALIRVCNIKSAPAKKMSRKDAMAQQRALNAQRRARMGSKG